MEYEARFWKKTDTSAIQCLLCPHTCIITNNQTGICGVRQNMQGILISQIYGKCSAIAVDPIEKKPLYHFFPGSNVLSLGSLGCTFQCQHCQNYSISQISSANRSLSTISPSDAVSIAKEKGCRGIAWTYNEPTIWHEYAYDTATLAKAQELYTVYVSNGYINPEPLEELSSVIDAINIDVKAFSDEFYHTICKGKLDQVKNTCERVVEYEMHLELTYLVIPGKNDSVDEIDAFCRWVTSALHPGVPVHFTRFHPDYKLMSESSTPIPTLKRIYDQAKDHGIHYVYLGNIGVSDYEDTCCPSCKKELILRKGLSVEMVGITSKGTCRYCSESIPIVLN